MRTSPRYEVGILADDLTSAADGAAPFVQRGVSAWIGRKCLPSQDCAMVAIDSGSRSLPVTRAAEVTSRLTRELASCVILYKTVDSTLRGHVRAELEACYAASGRTGLVFAPAFPAAGRTTVAGIQLVDGVPVAETAYGRDPVHPAHHSALAKLVPGSITNTILFDASTQEELDARVAAIPDPESILWVGSPGMAIALARRLRPAAPVATDMSYEAGRVLVAVGSANTRSHRQADRLADMDGVALMRTPRSPETDSAGLLRRLANAAAAQLRTSEFDALIATGGETMEAILDRLGIEAFEMLHELEPGFPLGRARLDDGRLLLIASKAGGFGDDDSLRRAVARMRPTQHLTERASH